MHGAKSPPLAAINSSGPPENDGQLGELSYDDPISCHGLTITIGRSYVEGDPKEPKNRRLDLTPSANNALMLCCRSDGDSGHL
jgi:hypothetical protein